MKWIGKVAGHAPLVFLVLSLLFLGLTGNLRIGPVGDEASASPATEAHAGQDHASESEEVLAAKAEGDWCAAHGVRESECVLCGAAPAGGTDACGSGDDACASDAAHSDAELERRAAEPCEHDVPKAACDDCRFEIGLVKVAPDVAGRLLRIGTRPGARRLPLTGQVSYDRTRVVEVAAPAGGRVLSIETDLGRRVEEGDLLAVVHSGEIASARAAALEAATACEIARKEQERRAGVTAALDRLLRALPGEIDRPLSGEAAGFEPEIPTGLVGEWKSKLVGAAADLRLQRARHRRERGLEEKGISARSEYEEAHRAYEAAKAEFAALVEEVKLSLGLDKLKADNALKQARARKVAAEQRLRVYGLSEDEIRRSESLGEDADFSRLELRAPRGGLVSELNLAVGRYVEANEVLFTVGDLDELWVWCDLFERDLETVSDRLVADGAVAAEVRVRSFPSRTFQGRLDLLGSELDVHTRTLKARVRVSNPEGRLRPGMFATADLLLPDDRPVTLVPRTAVLTDAGESFVFQHWKEDLWLRRDVTVGASLGDDVEIAAGLPAGARIAVGGGITLKSDVLRDKMGAG